MVPAGRTELCSTPAPLGSLSTVAGRLWTIQCHHPEDRRVRLGQITLRRNFSFRAERRSIATAATYFPRYIRVSLANLDLLWAGAVELTIQNTAITEKNNRRLYGRNKDIEASR